MNDTKTIEVNADHLRRLIRMIDPMLSEVIAIERRTGPMESDYELFFELLVPKHELECVLEGRKTKASQAPSAEAPFVNTDS